MKDEYQSQFSDDDKTDYSDNDLYSTSDKQLDLNSFVKSKDEGNTSKDNGKKGKKRNRKKKRMGFWKTILTGFLVLTITFCLIIGCFAIYVFGFVDGTVVEDLNDLKLNFTTTIFVKNSDTGQYQEYQRLHGVNNRIWIPFDKMPQNLKDAFVSIEDQRFYQHNGVDWKRTVSAFGNMFVHMYSSNQGGSTITQQLVKNLTGDDKQSPMRKIREIMRARNLESRYSKDTILECYLNTVAFANGIYGVEVASNYYFNKSAKDLSLSECATLAAIVKAPETYRPDTHLEKNVDRRKLVLDKMLELSKNHTLASGGITEEQHDKALKDNVKIVASDKSINEIDTNSYFVDALIDNVVDGLVKEYNYDRTYAEKNFYNGGYQIYCTMDPKIQEDCEQVFENSKFFPKSKKTGATVQGAFTIMDYSGHVVGIVGGAGEKTANRALNRATSSPRPPGSTMKPLGAYSLALDYNMITYSTMFKDQPITLANGTKWPPNWYKYYGGSVPVWKALERSVNTVPAQIVKQLTVEKSFDYLTNNLGINTLERDGNKDLTYSSLALGGSYKGITTLESAAAYAVFGNMGKYYKPTFYTKVTDQHGTVILDGESEPKVAIGEDTAVIMNHLLQNPVYGSQGTGKGAASYVPNMKIYAKTGTTDASNDLWFVGGTPYYIASCWYGFDKPETIANGGALRIWGNIMQKVNKNLPVKNFPESEFVTQRHYCTETGLLATSACPSTALGWYKTSYLPTCTAHRGTILGEVKVSSEVTSRSTSSSLNSSKTSSSGSSTTSSKTSSTTTSSAPPSSNTTSTETTTSSKKSSSTTSLH